MIRELIIENLLFFEDTKIEFKKGFNVVTGETGAGKTVLVNTLLNLVGEKTDISLRNTKSDATITGIFEISDEIAEELKNIDIYAEDELVIRKVIKPNNKHTIYLNDSVISSSTLKKIGTLLFDLHGQYDHQLLLKKENHIKIIDRISENDEILSEFISKYKEYNEQSKKLRILKEQLESFLKEKEFYEFALKELEQIDIEKIDEVKLKDDLSEMENFENIKEKIEYSLKLIDEDEININSLLSELKKTLKDVSNKSSKISKITENVDLIIENVSDLYKELYSYGETLFYDKNELDNLREKYDKLESLKRKYNRDLNGLIRFKEEIISKLKIVSDPEGELKNQENLLLEIKRQLDELALILHKRRESGSKKFEEYVNESFKKLNMKDTNLKIKIIFSPEIFNEMGNDDIEFFIANRFNEEGQPLKKIASGGEISRVMLSIKDYLRKNDPVMTMIFDEIDVGISGDTASKVAELMKNISKFKQIITITHLPQIAAKADNHILVSKESKNIVVKELNEKERVEEIARLLGSSESYETALKHAKALLKK
uniref:DNA repair protein RecN n=1 Tax=candidate division WOR-3 bacterium TaxID=2052148 RepID=A0A7C3N530_UNCW3